MSLEDRHDKLVKRLRARTKANGDPRPGFEQNVASIRAELEMISHRIEYVKEIQSGE
jgi:hypothetical protein